MKGERYGVNAPKIGPCMGDCGVPGRGRIKPCYPVGGGVWRCHDCIQNQQAADAARLSAGAGIAAIADGGTTTEADQ